MRSIDLIVATRNRYKKLMRMIRSVPSEAEGLPIRIRIMVDNDRETYEKLRDQKFDVQLITPQCGAVCCRNILSSQAQDAILYATDDISFREGSIAQAIRSMKERFPDGDGVIGFNQIGNQKGKFSKSGVALVGYLFLLRYPQKFIFYPKYFHFACQEVERAATILNRFFFDEKAVLVHFHPSFNRGEFDKTHVEARRFALQDRALSARRRRSRQTWGING